MIRHETWYKEADAYQYPKEYVDPLPSHLRGTMGTDFSDAAEKMRKWAHYLYLAFGDGFQKYDLFETYREGKEAWLRWKELQGQAQTDQADHRELHLLERKMDKIMNRLWSDYRNFVPGRVEELRKERFQQVESTR